MMETQQILLIISSTCLFSLWVEKRLALFSHISGVCLSILAAIILSSVGIIPHHHEIYDFFMGPAVPIAIALMVFGLQFKNIVGMPRTLLKIFAVGIIASISGGVIMAIALRNSLGENAPKLAAQLTASYIGGNENAVAISKILNVPNELFVAVFTIDNIVTSIWMAVTIALARSKPTEFIVDETYDRSFDSCPMTLVGVFTSIALGILSVELSNLAGRYIGLFHPMLYLSVVAFLISRIKVIQELIKPAYLIGTVIFVPFFFSTGAISDLRTLGTLPIEVIMMPFFIVGIHGIIIYSAGVLLQVPSCETSLASQALIGGAGTAVALAQVKNWKSGVPLGLMLGLVGYAIANFCGILVYHISTHIMGYMGSPL